MPLHVLSRMASVRVRPGTLRRALACLAVVFVWTAAVAAPPPGLAAGSRRSVVRLGAYSGTLVTGAWMATVSRDLILREALARRGLRLELIHFPGGPAMMTALATGRIDVAPLTEVYIFRAMAEAASTTVGLLSYSYCSVVSRTAKEPASLRDLRVAAVPDTISALTLARTLEAANLRRDQVQQVNLSVGEMPDALAKGRIDAFSAWEPTPQQTLRAHPEYRVLYRNASATLLVMRDAIAVQDPPLARELCSAFLRAYRWFGAHESHLLKAAGWALEANAPGEAANHADAVEGMRTLRTSVTGILGLPLLPLPWNADSGEGQRLFADLKRLGLASPAAGWEELRPRFDRGLMQAVLAQADRYRLEAFRYEE